MCGRLTLGLPNYSISLKIPYNIHVALQREECDELDHHGSNGWAYVIVSCGMYDQVTQGLLKTPSPLENLCDNRSSLKKEARQCHTCDQ